VCRAVVVDSTGVGGGLSAFLTAALSPRVVTPYVYTPATKSQLAYGLLEALACPDAGGSPRLAVYTDTDNPESNAARRELLHQVQAAVYELRANQVTAFSVPESRGNDDHLNALALLPQAAKLGALRAATARPPRQSSHGPFGNDHPSRR
jgi:hypothetical protein